MRRAVAIVVISALVVATAACGRGDDSVPRLQIVSLSATGRSAEVVFVAEDDGGDPLDITIDWGDRSPLDRFSGSGELRADHEYSDDIEAPVVIIELTNSAGRSVRTARTLAIAAATTTTSSTSSTSPTTTSSTTTSTSSTSSTAPSTTTTTTPPTTTTSTTTTTTSTTTTTTTTSSTTTEPAPEDYFVQLDFSNASDVDQPTTGTASTADYTDASASIEARTSGNTDDAFAGIVGVWTVSASVLEDLGDAPSVAVYLETTSDVSLDTGKNSGRGALFTIDLSGSVGGESIGSGSAAPVEIDDDDEFDDVMNDTLGFGSQLDPGGSGELRIALDIRCSAFGGSNIVQIGEQSRCAADVDLTEFYVRITPN
jgi:hypothetical protein